MRQSTSIILFAVLISQTQSAPQFITFKDGKLGVNFGGYHAGVGLGGLLGGNTAGGLYAEAGTPHGQSAAAGLGGAVGGGERGGPLGGLFAGATAGNGIKAQAGLAGGVNGGSSAAGTGYASAQAGNNYAATGMGGEASVEGSSGFTYTKKTSPIHKKIHTEINIDSANEIQPAAEVEHKVIHENIQPVVVKEVSKIRRPAVEVQGKLNFQVLFNYLLNTAFAADYYLRPWHKPLHSYILSQVHVAPEVVEKEVIYTHYKPRKHHLHKAAFLGGYIGGQGNIAGPEIQRRIDVDSSASANAGVDVAAGGNHNSGVGATYTKEVTIHKNPTFFADIFNIPIATLKAVGNLFGNTAANTHVSVEKSAHIDAETDSISSKHEPSSSPSSSSSSSAHISVETPSASKFFDDILAIPINTLGAVNKFLENNVPARKTVQVSEDGTVENSRVRLGPRKWRANKRVVVVKEETPVETVTEE